MRYFYIIDDYADPTLNTSFTDVAVAAASMFSGFSNIWKANYAYEAGKKMSSSGRISDEEVTKLEAVLGGMVGVRTKDEESYRKTNELIYGTEYSQSKSFRSDIEQWYGELKRQLAVDIPPLWKQRWYSGYSQKLTESSLLIVLGLTKLLLTSWKKMFVIETTQCSKTSIGKWA